MELKRGLALQQRHTETELDKERLSNDLHIWENKTISLDLF
jgi:hypothetical protein